MIDRFSSYEELAKELVEGVDYEVNVVEEARASRCAIIAPHGGRIEHGTSEIAKEVAGDWFRRYSFEGKMKRGNFAHLHITSHKFDEARCLKLIADCKVVLAVHGRRDLGDPETTGVSGLNQKLVEAVVRHLRSAGLRAALDTAFPAREPRNICNRGQTGQGAQIEIPHTLRLCLEEDRDLIRVYSNALRAAIEEVTEADWPTQK